MNKTRMIYLAILILAALVLIWDKTASRDSITNPAPSMARPVPAPSSPTTDSPASLLDEIYSPDPPTTNHPAPSLSPILSRDIFTPGELFRQALAAEPEESVGPSRDGGTWHLSAVLVRQHRSCALVNGEVVVPGQTIDGYRLLQIEHDHIVLQSGKDRLVLFLED